jgi:ATP-binding cassette, subfamily B, bacterial PglK
MSASNEINRNIWRLYGCLKPQTKLKLKLLLGLMLVAAAAEVVNLGALLPLIAIFASPEISMQKPVVRDIFIFLGERAQADPAWTATVLFIIATLIATSIRLLLLMASARATSAIAHEFSEEVFRRSLLQPYATHIAINSSSVLASIQKVDEVSAVLYTITNAIGATVVSICILLTIAFISPLFACVAPAIFILIYMLFTRITRSRLSRNSKKITTGYSERIQTAQESLGGIRDIILDQTHGIFIQKFSSLDDKMRVAYAENMIIAPLTRFLSEATGMIFIALLGYWITRAQSAADAFSALSAIAFGAQRILPMALQIYSGYTVIHGSQHSVADVLSLLSQPVEQDSSCAKQVEFRRELRLENICFRYAPDGPLVLEGVTLSIPQGGRIGFVGATGGGKSTLLDLVMGLLAPSSGQILVDDVSITETGARLGWQRNIAHVPQAIYLVDGTITENIAFGVPLDRIDPIRVQQVAEDAQIADFIESLPQGYRTHVGERGVRLSGGQRQRIGIARALYKKPAILVLDEATCALDSETEAAVMKTIYTLRRDLTLLMIAHRTTTLAGCDAIYKLQGGKLLAEAAF